LRKTFVLIGIFAFTIYGYSQSYEGIVIGTTFDTIEVAIPKTAIFSENALMQGCKRITFMSESIGSIGEVNMLIYKDVLVSLYRRYPASLKERLVNALSSKYGATAFPGSKSWRLNGVEIFILELNTTNEILLSYDLLSGVGQEFYDILRTGGSRKEDSSHF
jgi:hypothetical protein